jgi:hypothetical protein
LQRADLQQRSGSFCSSFPRKLDALFNSEARRQFLLPARHFRENGRRSSTAELVIHLDLALLL